MTNFGEGRWYRERRMHETDIGGRGEKIGLISSKNRNATRERRVVVIARPGKYRRALVLEFHSVSFSPLFFELRNNATPSRNVTRSYRPLPLFPSFFRLAFGRPLSPFSLPSLLPLPLFAISRATVFHLSRLCPSRRPFAQPANAIKGVECLLALLSGTRYHIVAGQVFSSSQHDWTRDASTSNRDFS